MKKLVILTISLLVITGCIFDKKVVIPPTVLHPIVADCVMVIGHDNYRTYHLRYTEEMAKQMKLLLSKIYDLEGVTNIYPSGYQIGVSKGILYSWDEIQPKIAQLILDFQQCKLIEEVDPEELY